MCGIVGIFGHPAGGGASLSMPSNGSSTAAMTRPGVATLESGTFDAPARRRKAQEPAGPARAAIRSPAPSVSAITRWATHGRAETRSMPIRTPPIASPWSITALSRISANCARRWSGMGASLQDRDRHGSRPPHLVTQEMKDGRSPVEAVKAALPQLRGAFALAFLFAGEDDLIIGARRGSPLAIGYGGRRDVCGLRRHRSGPVHGHNQLSRGRRLGGGSPWRRGNPCRRRAAP